MSRGSVAAVTPAAPIDPLPHRLTAGGRTFVVDRGREEDVAAIVVLLRDDLVGASREAAPGESLEDYREAFRAIDGDPHQLLVVVRDDAGVVVGTLQLSFLRTLARRGVLRLQVEAVRVASSTRGSGLGRALLAWALEHGRTRGAEVAQLTSDLRRTDAHRFYEGLGWRHTHAGMKLDLR